MKSSKCHGCREHGNCKDSFLSWVFFIIGIIATIAVRVVTVLMHLRPVYAKMAWYIGIGGFFLFFIYKFRVNQRHAKTIAERNLINKIESGKGMSAEDYSLIGSILCGASSKKERINYVFIFGLSAVALAIAIYMDFLR